MKILKYLVVLFLFLPSSAFAQFGLSGGGIAGTGIQPFSKSTNTYSGGGGGNNNSRDNENESRPQRHEMTPEEKQAQRDWNDYNKLVSRGYNAKTVNDWYALAKRTNWGVAWLNYAYAAKNSGNTEAALNVFMWLKDCGNHADKSVCSDAADQALAIKNQQAIDVYNMGVYDAAIYDWRLMAQTFPDDPIAYYNIAVTLEKQGKMDEAYAAAKESAARTGFTGDPFREKAINLYYNEYENVEFGKALHIIQSQIHPDYDAAKEYLRHATRYDAITGHPSYNARAILASIEHVQGDNDAALNECTTVISQHPGDETCSQIIASIATK
jgi:Tetratricopeptide repeat